LPAVVVAVLCGPWQLMTMAMAQRGWTGGDQPSISYSLRALGEFLPMLVDLLGWGLAPLVLMGVVVTVGIPYFRGTVKAEWASLFGLIVAAWLFHSIVPAGVEQRKLVIAVPALILFLFAGGNWLAERLGGKRAVIALAAIAIFGMQKFSIPHEVHYGYIEAAKFIRSNPDLHNLTILVSSDSDGEGMLISELAMGDKRPAHTIFRGTKKLALTNWQGQIFECFYQTPEQLLAYLEQANVGLLVSDVLPPVTPQPQQQVVQAALDKYPNRLKLIAKFTGDVRGSVNVYRVY
jgi:hypothetical protein